MFVRRYFMSKHICPICNIPFTYDENGEQEKCHSDFLNYGTNEADY